MIAYIKSEFFVVNPNDDDARAHTHTHTHTHFVLQVIATTADEDDPPRTSDNVDRVVSGIISNQCEDSVVFANVREFIRKIKASCYTHTFLGLPPQVVVVVTDDQLMT